MTKEHKKLYKAGKNWIVATLTATTITLLGGIGAYTVHADTTIESSQDVQTNQVNNTNNSVTLNNNQPVAVQSSQTAQNNQSVKGNQTNQTVPSSATDAADTSNSDGLDSNIYGTVNVKDWDYQNDSNTFNLTSYHGQDTKHIIVPNLNDFNNAGVKIGNATGVGISSVLAKNLASRSVTFAISKTSGNYNNKVIATDQNWSGVFGGTGLINVDVSNLDTRNITNMSWLFANSNALKTVGDLSQWNTSNVTNMSYLFSFPFVFGHYQLNNVGDLGKWDTRSVTDMSDMFGDSSVVPGNIGNWNVSNVKDMSNMFDNNHGGDIGDLSHWDTSNVTSMFFMFFGSSTSVSGLTHWNTKNVRDMKDMFEGSGLPYKIVASNEGAVVPNQVTLKDSTGKILALIDTPTIYDSNKSVRSTIDGIVQAEINKLNKLNHTSYETPKIISDGDDDYSIANSTYVVNNESKTGLINYVDQDGKVVKTDQVSGKVGDKVDVKLSLPDGYELANKDEQVPSTITVGDDGIKTININIKKIPVTKTGTINYIDPDGKVVKTDHVSGKVGDQINVKLSLPDGYELANKDEQVPSVITVTENGIGTINVNIKKIPVIKTGTINYIDPDGKVVKTDQVSGKVGDKVDVKLSLPDGYELANKDEQIPSSITVGEDGIKTITIQVKKLPVVQTGSINYVDQDGKVIKTDTISGKVGDQINVKLSLPDGYELANKDEQVPSTITVGNDGIKTININVKKIPVIKTGTINYIDPDGKVVKTDQVSGKVGDTVDVKLSLPDGYELANKDEQVPSTITVTENGIGTINVNVKKINTTLANNEVPYDSTTISNNVNANYGYLDSYKLTENNQGQAQLIASGWHATGASNSDRYRYMIVFDNTLGHEIARQKLVPQVRSDVQRAYPNVDNSLYSGFNITIDIPNSSINHSLSLIARYSNDPNNGEGARVDYWFNPLALNEGNQAYLDGLSSNGNTLTVTGWHATNQAAGRPYHYIIAWDRNLGHEIARQKVTAVSRPDVANAYSTVANAVNSGFSVKFNLTPQFFNDNIQFISRWTDDAAGNGNAVDYWFKPMNRTNRANLDSVTLSNGQVKVAGWHATDLSQLEPNHYLIVFDNTTGQQVASEKVDLQSSQDVKNVFGDIQTADHSRFNYTFNSLHLIPGHNYSLVSRYSADATGNGNDGAHTDSWLNMGTFQQSAYWLDNVALKNRHMTVQGWLANDYAMTRPYAYAILLQNGHEIGRQRLNLSERADVAKVYPQIYRSQYSGFNTSFDLPTASTNGLQLVLRFTDDPAGNGNSSDKWINL